MLEELEKLERELHQPSTRSSLDRLSELTHADFREFGKSGREYDLKNILERLPQETDTVKVWSGNYELQFATPDSALILYKSAHITPDGQLSAFAVRSSLWVKNQSRWQILFHQGTPTEAFEVKTV